jgi:hypothetical protein
MTMAPPSRRAPPVPPPPLRSPPSNDRDIVENGNGSMSAAADLIRTLDSAFAEMSSLSISAAKDAEDARRNARAASEMARRYTSRSFPSHEILNTPTASSSASNLSPYSPATSPSASSLQVQTMMKSSKEHSSLTLQYDGSPRKRKNQINVTPSDRLAQSHAEDVLAVSLELERTKQALEMERREHDQTRMGYTEYKAKNAQLEAQVEKILSDMERRREEQGRVIDRMKDDLNHAKARVKAADEDAQAAVELATEANASKQQLETWLQKALEEITILRQQLESLGVNEGSVMPTANSSKKHSVRFSDSNTVVMVPNREGKMVVASPPSTPPPIQSPPHAMVVAGRTILAKATRVSDSKMHAITMTPQQSADRREALRLRLKNMDDALPPIPKPPPPPNVGVDMGFGQKAMEACHTVGKILRESAGMLKISGRWVPSNAHDDVGNLEKLARRYCHSVEVSTISAI